jgi:hypothetical protein
MKSMFSVPPAVGATFDGVNPGDYTRIAKEIQLNLMANSILLTALIAQPTMPPPSRKPWVRWLKYTGNGHLQGRGREAQSL